MQVRRFLHWQSFWGKTVCDSLPWFCPTTCLGYLGWRDTNRIISVGVTSCKMVRASRGEELRQGIVIVFAKKLCPCKWAFRDDNKLDCLLFPGWYPQSYLWAPCDHFLTGMPNVHCDESISTVMKTLYDSILQLRHSLHKSDHKIIVRSFVDATPGTVFTTLHFLCDLRISPIS
jgi:hypothetical protein